MIPFVRSTLHPAVYRGHGKKPPFFEGWYYRLVDTTGEHRYAILHWVPALKGETK